jgi:hypothetical protein
MLRDATLISLASPYKLGDENDEQTALPCPAVLSRLFFAIRKVW